MALKGSRTEANLKTAFARESQASRRCLYFARRADIEGHADVAGLLRDLAEGESGHAFGHLEILEELGDPVTGAALGDTATNLRAAIAAEIEEQNDLYPGFAATARSEGLVDVAEWFDTLARAEAAHVARLSRALDALEPA